MYNISILGSTGSIGRQALKVIDKLGDTYNIVALTANSNAVLLAEQARKYKPELLVLANESELDILKRELIDSKVKIEGGEKALIKAATWPSADIILISVVGFSGFNPVIASLRSGKRIALANKESLVVGGELIEKEIPGFRDLIIPVDSEHSAIYQCLRGESKKNIKRIILTASGGPFRGMEKKQLEKVTPEEALKHPNWSMGAKITIDSATLMNKGFEVLEASWLFGVGLDEIDVVIHPQSLVHSLVEFKDGSVIAQMSSPDMTLPIQYAFTFPERVESLCSPVDLVKQSLKFEKPDNENFPCLSYAYRSGKIGGTMPAAINAANEVAVDLFLRGKINFTEIAVIIKETMDNHKTVLRPKAEDILKVDAEIRQKISKRKK